MEFCVYILASFRRTLYVGVTNDLPRCLTEHRAASYATFVGKYRVNRLVYFDSAESPMDAIERKKQIKGWRRAKKIALVEGFNPAWRDLSEDILGAPGRSNSLIE
ncbi:MAG TPA: GIY-YIG nuclease family protein [Dehalococcoidia bacterium]|nr:GIY-YIG nuclease family protein [Dehalococcoidia bacterium]